MRLLIWPLIALAACQPAWAQDKRPVAKMPVDKIAVPKAILSPSGPAAPDLSEEDDDEPEMSLPLKDGMALKGKLGGSWNFGTLPGTSSQLDNFGDPKGRKFEMPGLHSEKHMTIGGRKSQTNGLSFGFDFDLPQ